jgi:hypothetical protein
MATIIAVAPVLSRKIRAIVPQSDRTKSDDIFKSGDIFISTRNCLELASRRQQAFFSREEIAHSPSSAAESGEAALPL